MADAAFTTAKFPGFTTAELSRWLANHSEGKPMLAGNLYHDVCAELTRRGKVNAGDVSVMTHGERFRSRAPKSR